jgi:hypothetical protein
MKQVLHHLQHNLGHDQGETKESSSSLSFLQRIAHNYRNGHCHDDNLIDLVSHYEQHPEHLHVGQDFHGHTHSMPTVTFSAFMDSHSYSEDQMLAPPLNQYKEIHLD